MRISDWSSDVCSSDLQGLVLFGLYLAGIVGALVVAWALRRTVAKGAGAGFMMEMPRYQMPQPRDILLGLWQRAWIFLRRAGTIIAMTTVVLWLLLTFPQAPEGESQVEYSVAGRIASGLEVVVAPIGRRPEERRVGKTWVSTGKYRGSP